MEAPEYSFFFAGLAVDLAGLATGTTSLAVSATWRRTIPAQLHVPDTKLGWMPRETTPGIYPGVLSSSLAETVTERARDAG